MSMEVVSWWMLDLARAAAGDKFMALLHYLQKILKNYTGGTLLTCRDISHYYIFGSI